MYNFLAIDRSPDPRITTRCSRFFSTCFVFPHATSRVIYLPTNNTNQSFIDQISCFTSSDKSCMYGPRKIPHGVSLSDPLCTGIITCFNGHLKTTTCPDIPNKPTNCANPRLKITTVPGKCCQRKWVCEGRFWKVLRMCLLCKLLCKAWPSFVEQAQAYATKHVHLSGAVLTRE